MTKIKRFDILPGVVASVLLFFTLATYIYNHAQEEVNISTERSLNAYTQEALSAKTRILSIRELEKIFFLTRSPQDATLFKAEIDDAIHALLQPSALADAPPGTELLTTLRKYEQAAHEAVRLRFDLGLNHNSGLQGKLRRAAHSAEANFQSMRSDKLLAELMYLRRHEKDFIMRLEPKYIEAFEQRMDSLRATVVQQDVSPDRKQKILNDLTVYQQSFERWIENRMALRQVTGTLHMLFEDMSEQLEGIATSIDRTRRDFTAAGGRASSSAELSLAFAGLIALIFCLTLFRQVFEQRNMAREIQEMAHLDTLTKLPNRRGFADALDRVMEHKNANPEPLLVGLIDLDGFKAVNDVYGQAAGDALLTQAAERIRHRLPEGTSLARLGGDEFGLFLAYDDDARAIEALGRSLCATLKEPFYLKEGVARIGGSIGFSVVKSKNATLASVIERADYALHYSKQNCKGDPVLFSTEHERQIAHSRQLERLLINTNFKDEIEVAFQPIVEPVSGTIRGMEALARWHSPIAGDVPPDAFIPLAEKAGKINEITCAVLSRALDAAAQWPDDIFVSINLSAMDIASREAAKRLTDIVRNSKLAKSRIVFELTETVLMQEFERTNETLERFRALGIQIALDDFGTGYSSLSYLQHMTVDRLKIDRSFIADLVSNPTSQRVLRGIVGLCASLDIDCIIEGVENQAQSKLIADYGAHLAQGYYFSRPMSGDDTLALVEAQKTGHQTRLIA